MNDNGVIFEEGRLEAMMVVTRPAPGNPGLFYMGLVHEGPDGKDQFMKLMEGTKEHTDAAAKMFASPFLSYRCVTSLVDGTQVYGTFMMREMIVRKPEDVPEEVRQGISNLITAAATRH